MLSQIWRIFSALEKQILRLREPRNTPRGDAQDDSLDMLLISGTACLLYPS